ncbi:MAG: damage-inducible protein CinA [SAR116 cluster bacterium]|jgi:nicotinamide-nucleotide amidase|nr:damage-inducible protein CinA [SAR116 cluster bacterium]|tara:strand:- start:101 stop:586 length:486 start_codon:yes stop_codon:yes gene_type:complete
MDIISINAAEIVTSLKQSGMRICCAESCTGGMIAAAITDIAGSSAVFSRGFVTYSNQAKINMLGVKPETLNLYGAVSGQTVSEMASGAITASEDEADFAVAVSGIAGPDGGTVEKPVGLVYICVLKKGEVGQVTRYVFDGDRQSVRTQTVENALKTIRGLM